MDFDKAYEKILKDDRTDGNPVPDPMRFSYISVYKEELFSSLNRKIENGKYSVKPLLEIDVPKPNFTIRPMARPEILDWVVYQAIIDDISKVVAPKLSNRSYSLLNFKPNSPKKKTQAWLLFDLKSRKLFESGYKYAVITDISSYFENISLVELKRKLTNYVDVNDKLLKKKINILFGMMLSKWSNVRVKEFGLPQGPTASLFLGDLYLDNVDSEMKNEDGYLRYVDDIRIFCRDERSAKVALINLIKSLRKYKLNINAKKTRILQNKEVSEQLFDFKKPQLDAIQEAFDSGNLDRIQAIIGILVEDIFAGGFDETNPFAARHLRFSIPKLEMLKTSGLSFNDDFVLGQILNNFLKLPHHSSLFCRFLSSFLNKHKIRKFLINFLSSADNIYDWQEMHILRLLMETNVKRGGLILKLALKKFKNKNAHWMNRSLYCLLIGKFGKVQDREVLSDGYYLAENNELKQNIILATQELGRESRRDFYKNKSNDLGVKGFLEYVTNLKRPMYFRPYYKQKIDNLNDVESISYPY